MTPVQLTPSDWASLRAASLAVADAMREAELAAARAKVAIGEAVAHQIALVRALADKYGLDPDAPLRLGPNYTLLVDPAREAQP